VFGAGLEDGLLPHARALEESETDGSPIDEELRLCYVAITRAVDRLFLTYARQRPRNGRALPAEPSRFLRRIPGELLERHAA
jgi:DNA helicase-2/ATP-dependent DNA helicase PcrA